MKITGTELLARARVGRPNVEYRLDAAHASIAARVGHDWHRVAGKLISRDEWIEMGDLLVNGQRLPFEPDMSS